MLAKERSDMQVLEIQRTLKKNEIRFQKIVETANEGILVFDGEYKVIFANKNISSILGYEVYEILGRTYSSFFPENQMDIYKYQESLRKKGDDSAYECCLKRKDGKSHWFLVSAKAILDDADKFEGSFAILTDINERKEMELLLEESNRHLTELSNKDSLTGIANRRCFDAALEHEYQKIYCILPLKNLKVFRSLCRKKDKEMKMHYKIRSKNLRKVKKYDYTNRR